MFAWLLVTVSFVHSGYNIAYTPMPDEATCKRVVLATIEAAQELRPRGKEYLAIRCVDMRTKEKVT